MSSFGMGKATASFFYRVLKTGPSGYVSPIHRWREGFQYLGLRQAITRNSGHSLPNHMPRASNFECIFAVAVYLAAVHLAVEGHLGHLTIAKVGSAARRPINS